MGDQLVQALVQVSDNIAISGQWIMSTAGEK